MHCHLRPLALLPVLALAACSSSGADTTAGGATGAAGATAPASVPFATGSTATAPAPTTAAPAPAGGTPTSEMVMTAEMITNMLASEQGRQLVVAGMASRAGITVEQATCFIDHVKVETLVAMAGLQSPDPAAALASAPPEALADLQQAVVACNIPVSALLPH